MDPRASWALGRWIQISIYVAPRPIKPAGKAVDVRIYSYACTNMAAMADAALPKNDFVVDLREEQVKFY